MTFKLLVIVGALLLFAGMIGHTLGLRGRDRPKPPSIETARKCPTCGDYLIGPAGCDRPGCPET